MTAAPKIPLGAALRAPFALATRGSKAGADLWEKHDVTSKFGMMKDHKAVSKITESAEILWTLLGFVLIFHGAQFKNLFLCTQVMTSFCYERIKTTGIALRDGYAPGSVPVAEEKKEDEPKEGEEAKEDAGADAKAKAEPASKHAQKRADKKNAPKEDPKAAKKGGKDTTEEDAAAAKEALKGVDSSKVSELVFELCVAAMSCHMVMEGGVVTAVVITHALVRFFKAKIVGFLDFSDFADMPEWTDLLVSFLLYVFFGGMALLARPVALALNVAVMGANLVLPALLRLLEAKGKIPNAAEFEESTKGLMGLAGLITFGHLWQLWALMADSGMAWYFMALYSPAYMLECFISLF